METSTTRELIGWFIGLLATSGIALIIGIFNIIKSGKMLKRDIKGADLDNKSKEVSLAEQYDVLATKAAEKVLKMQERLDQVESQSLSVGNELEVLKERIEQQDEIISKQALIIEEQSKRLDLQESKIKEQQEEITRLSNELRKERDRNYSLIAQMQENNIIPKDPTEKEPEVTVKKITRKRKKDNGNKI